MWNNNHTKFHQNPMELLGTDHYFPGGGEGRIIISRRKEILSTVD